MAPTITKPTVTAAATNMKRTSGASSSASASGDDENIKVNAAGQHLVIDKTKQKYIAVLKTMPRNIDKLSLQQQQQQQYIQKANYSLTLQQQQQINRDLGREAMFLAHQETKAQFKMYNQHSQQFHRKKLKVLKATTQHNQTHPLQ